MPWSLTTFFRLNENTSLSILFLHDDFSSFDYYSCSRMILLLGDFSLQRSALSSSFLVKSGEMKTFLCLLDSFNCLALLMLMISVLPSCDLTTNLISRILSSFSFQSCTFPFSVFRSQVLDLLIELILFGTWPERGHCPLTKLDTVLIGRSKLYTLVWWFSRMT